MGGVILKQKLRMETTIVLCLSISTLFYVNIVSKQLWNDLGSNYFFVWLILKIIPLVFAGRLLEGYIGILYNQMYRSIWKYVYMNQILLLVSMFIVISIEDIWKFNQYITNGCFILVFVVIALLQQQIDKEKKKNDYNRKEEMSIVEEINKQIEVLSTKENKAMYVFIGISWVLATTGVRKITFSIVLISIILYYIYIVWKQKYNCSVFLSKEPWMSVRLVAWNSICLLLAIIIYQRVTDAFVVALLMLSQVYSIRLSDKVLRILYKKEHELRLVEEQEGGASYNENLTYR